MNGMANKDSYYNVIISIKPSYAEMILNGKKKYEFRKNSFTKPVGRILIYSTKPVGKIVGYFAVEEVLRGKPSEIWNLCSEFAGISKGDFYKYFEYKNVAYALKIDKVCKLKKPINPFGIIKGFRAPRSFRYIDYEITEGSIL